MTNPGIKRAESCPDMRYVNGSRHIAVYACILTISQLRAADLAAPQEYEGKSVTAVRYEPPSQPVTRADLSRLVPFQPGTPLRLSDVRTAIKKLYSTGRYASVEADTEPAPEGVTLVFRTTEQWFVGPLEVGGNIKLPPNRGQLSNAARLELGTPYEDEDLKTALQN